jgi:hypothetical protein
MGKEIQRDGCRLERTKQSEKRRERKEGKEWMSKRQRESVCVCVCVLEGERQNQREIQIDRQIKRGSQREIIRKKNRMARKRWLERQKKGTERDLER